MVEKKKLPASGSLSQLEELVHQVGMHLKSLEKSAEASGPVARNPVLPPDSPAEPPEPSDDEIFSEAMNGVERVSWNRKFHPSSEKIRVPDADPEIEERRMMQEAMEADHPIPIPEHPEYIEGWIGVAGKRFLPDLRSGLYSIQGQIDLHGMNQAEAHAAVEEYIIRVSRFRPCCIKIIHGRGLNSPVDRATLKDSLPRFLSTRKMSRHVVAYASAPSPDGGVGSLYVLLKSRLP